MSVSPLLPSLASDLKDWFPESGGRVIAVSNSEVTRENMPSLPLIMLALDKETATHHQKSGAYPEITEEFRVEFWSTPGRYRREDGSETPFWSFYNYAAVRDRLLARLRDWQSPQGSRLQYVELEVESHPFATVLCFHFKHEFRWCPDVVDTDDDVLSGDGKPLVLSARFEPIGQTLVECECEPKQTECRVCKLD